MATPCRRSSSHQCPLTAAPCRSHWAFCLGCCLASSLRVLFLPSPSRSLFQMLISVLLGLRRTSTILISRRERGEPGVLVRSVRTEDQSSAILASACLGLPGTSPS